MSRKIIGKNYNFLIIESDSDFSKGLLLPYNITYHGEEISLPFSKGIINRIILNNDLLNDLTIISKYGEENQYALLGYDCEKLLTSCYVDDDLAENFTYDAQIISKNETFTLLGINGHYGYINAIIPENIGDYIKVVVSEKAKNRYTFNRFVEINSNIEENDLNETIDSVNISEFLTKEELDIVSDEERNAIDGFLKKMKGTTRKNIEVVRIQLHISYNPNKNINLQKFLHDHPDYFNQNNFWLSTYRDKITDDVCIVLYDKNDVFVKICTNRNGFFVIDFSSEKTNSSTQTKLNRSSKTIAIAGSNLYFHDEMYPDKNAKENAELIFLQFDITMRILPQIKRDIRAIKEKQGFEYLTLKTYIDYQLREELKFKKENCIIVAPYQAHIVTSSDDHFTAIGLPKLIVNVESLYMDGDEDECHVEILITGERPISGYIKESSNRREYILNFFDTQHDFEKFCTNGFQLRRRVSSHLERQMSSIENFVYSKDGFDIFNKLNKRELCQPEPDYSISFFDDKFNHVEDGNNQPLAIRKAVNNEDIFLIQGPPGTGKTSVIIEIIKQLVNKGEKVLVCSQAHAAVDNIYRRLIDADLKLCNIDLKESRISDDLPERQKFIQRNIILMDKLSEESANPEEIKDAASKYEYSSSSKDDFRNDHQYICKYYKDNIPSNISELKNIMEEFSDGLSELGDEAKAFNEARYYRGRDVVMGTCIGIGMDRGLRDSGIKFDTVIIDEAGKANLAETTVPMQLGRKYILVGDSKQLPPYIDTQEVKEFVKNNTDDLSELQVEKSISSSLFEDFLTDSNFPDGNKILLNFQYRMNPEIGDYISDLFYGKELKNGRGTEQQICNLEKFPEPVTFIDTTTKEKCKDSNRNKAYELGNAQEGWYNLQEIEVFSERLLQSITNCLNENPSLTVGIITPYRKQRSLLLEKVRGTALENSVYTIDSIQGNEFDIVVLSLVRSFYTLSGNRKVGFLDDMRRLNVALSRAKKKLIIIGNLQTLCDPRAHNMTNSTICDVKPIEVFKKLKNTHDITATKNSIQLFQEAYDEGKIKENQLFSDCKWYRDRLGMPVVIINYNNNELRMTLNLLDKKIDKYAHPNFTIDVKFLRLKNGKPLFEYIPDVPIARQIMDGLVNQIEGFPIEWKDEKNELMIFEFHDRSQLPIKVNTSCKIFQDMLGCPGNNFLPLKVWDDTAFLDNKVYTDFANKYPIGSVHQVEVIDDTLDKYYIVKCKNIYGEVKKASSTLSINSLYDAQIFKYITNLSSSNKEYVQNIIFKIVK